MLSDEVCDSNQLLNSSFILRALYDNNNSMVCRYKFPKTSPRNRDVVIGITEDVSIPTTIWIAGLRRRHLTTLCLSTDIFNTVKVAGLQLNDIIKQIVFIPDHQDDVVETPSICVESKVDVSDKHEEDRIIPLYLLVERVDDATPKYPYIEGATEFSDQLFGHDNDDCDTVVLDEQYVFIDVIVYAEYHPEKKYIIVKQEYITSYRSRIKEIQINRDGSQIFFMINNEIHMIVVESQKIRNTNTKSCTTTTKDIKGLTLFELYDQITEKTALNALSTLTLEYVAKTLKKTIIKHTDEICVYRGAITRTEMQEYIQKHYYCQEGVLQRPIISTFSSFVYVPQWTSLIILDNKHHLVVVSVAQEADKFASGFFLGISLKDFKPSSLHLSNDHSTLYLTDNYGGRYSIQLRNDALFVTDDYLCFQQYPKAISMEELRWRSTEECYDMIQEIHDKTCIDNSTTGFCSPGYVKISRPVVYSHECQDSMQLSSSLRYTKDYNRRVRRIADDRKRIRISSYVNFELTCHTKDLIVGKNRCMASTPYEQNNIESSDLPCMEHRIKDDDDNRSAQLSRVNPADAIDIYNDDDDESKQETETDAETRHNHNTLIHVHSHLRNKRLYRKKLTFRKPATSKDNAIYETDVDHPILQHRCISRYWQFPFKLCAGLSSATPLIYLDTKYGSTIIVRQDTKNQIDLLHLRYDAWIASCHRIWTTNINLPLASSSTWGIIWSYIFPCMAMTAKSDYRTHEIMNEAEFFRHRLTDVRIASKELVHSISKNRPGSTRLKGSCVSLSTVPVTSSYKEHLSHLTPYESIIPAPAKIPMLAQSPKSSITTPRYSGYRRRRIDASLLVTPASHAPVETNESFSKRSKVTS